MVQFQSDHLVVHSKSDHLMIIMAASKSDETRPSWWGPSQVPVRCSGLDLVSWCQAQKSIFFTKAEVSSLIVATVVTLKVFSSWSCLFCECGCSVITRTHWNLKLSDFRWMWNFCNYSDKGGVGIVKEQRHIFNQCSSSISSSYWRWWWWHGQRKGGEESEL